MIKDYEIPLFFRVLIIDDMVAASENYNEFFTNILTALVLEEAGGEIPMAQVNVEFELDPVKGFKRWQNEPFDLTLIDSDFSKNLTKDETSDLKKYALNSEYQGFNILHLIHALVFEGKFSYREEACNFFLWSGLDEKEKITPYFDIFKTIEKDDYYIPKNSTLTELQSKIKIKDSIEKIKKCEFTIEHEIERFLFSLKKNIGGLFQDISGGCLIYDKHDKFPFLRKLEKANSFVVCPARIPDPVLKSDKIPFIPLSGKFLGQRGVDMAISILEKKSWETPDNYLHLKNRCSLLTQNKSIPLFQNETKKEPENGTSSLLGYPLKNHFIAAVTPLTSTTVIGHEEAIDALHDKVIALLEGPFGAVIFKTVYLDSFNQWNRVNWPAIQVQSHNRARCLFPDTGTATIWHTGRTALEMLQPRQLNQLLKRFLSTNRVDTHRVIISLGSKFRSKWPVAQYDSFSSIWGALFEQVFGGIHEDCFPIVEINVRHFLREIVKAWIGGDEYLNPHDLREEPKEREAQFRDEFNHWLQALHDTAVEYKKKLILKFPHRSDTLSFVQSTLALRTHFMECNPVGIAEFGVRAITLVNALKTPVSHGNKVQEYTSKWYAHPWAWQDASSKTLKYQMSGRYLAPYRNQILAGLVKSLSKFEKLKMEILISGGITKNEDIEYLKSLDKNKRVFTGFQIGTSALIKTSLGKQKWDRKNTSTPYSDAKNRKNSSNKAERKPREIEVSKPKKEFISPRIAFCDVRKCKRCGECHTSFFCDSFMDRVNITSLPPLMDSRNCSGCGLCVQLCKHGALHLYHPEEMLVLVSSSMERQEILRSIGVPFLAYKPRNDLNRFSKIFKSVKLKKGDNFLDAVKKAFKNPTRVLLTEIVEKIWEVRLADEFLLGKGREKLYPDLRPNKEPKNKCLGTATDLIKKLATAQNKAEKLTIARAVIWSQLIWSDPGQVLWDSHILTLKTILQKQDENREFHPDTRSISDLNHETSFFIISSYVVLMRQGEIILADRLDSEKFHLNKLKADSLNKYNNAEMGKDRLAGIDVRACGDFLIEDFSKVEKKDRQAMAGLPWDILRERIPNPHKAAFMSMQNAVSSRNE
jgi:predicted house-cleaning NTP pyrophosphatase (Maf/HAM1 superfamily)/Pyruvate/2-oxoacid:ferredoxin oxidoreductase delta subunit